MISEKLLTPDEVAILFRIQKKTVLDWSREGLLKPIHFRGRRVLFLESDVEDIMRSGLPSRTKIVKFSHELHSARAGCQKGSWE